MTKRTGGAGSLIAVFWGKSLVIVIIRCSILILSLHSWPSVRWIDRIDSFAPAEKGWELKDKEWEGGALQKGV